MSAFAGVHSAIATTITTTTTTKKKEKMRLDEGHHVVDTLVMSHMTRSGLSAHLFAGEAEGFGDDDTRQLHVADLVNSVQKGGGGGAFQNPFRNNTKFEQQISSRFKNSKKKR